MKKGNGGMTLEKLARMVAEGFKHATTKEELKKTKLDLWQEIKEVKEKLTEHDARFSKLDSQIEEILEILDRLEEKDILDLQKRINTLERAVKTINKHLN